mmetsp:Transcript_36061/g.64522  ORF Transcript_36061/g.64522 Transcript_36061/m.64522 type:complete len:213 (-) Transcript_36061:893-1531(-)
MPGSNTSLRLTWSLGIVIPWLLWIVMAQASRRGSCVRSATVSSPKSQVHFSGLMRSSCSSLTLAGILNFTNGRRPPSSSWLKRVTMPRAPLTRPAGFSRFMFFSRSTCAPTARSTVFGNGHQRSSPPSPNSPSIMTSSWASWVNTSLPSRASSLWFTSSAASFLLNSCVGWIPSSAPSGLRMHSSSSATESALSRPCRTSSNRVRNCCSLWR